MRLLIDTHALLWFFEGNSLLSAKARAAMEDDTNEFFVSHVTPWEVAIKLALGRLTMDVPYEVVFPKVLDANGFKLLPTTLDHFRELISLPRHHGDPFDRLLIVQAKMEGLTIVSSDSHFTKYGMSLLW
jgi:PIN domain nuclease of toxin-antitoxin system